MREEASERWSALFADLEARFDAELAAAELAELAERRRFEIGRLGLVERLRGSLAAGPGHPEVVVRFGVGPPLPLALSGVGPDWLLGVPRAGGASEVVVALAAVVGVDGLGPAADAREPGRVWAGLDLRKVLRGLALRRAAVLLTAGGDAPAHGTIDRVYADHLDLALHPHGEPRRDAAVSAVRAVPLAAISSVSRLL